MPELLKDVREARDWMYQHIQELQTRIPPPRNIVIAVDHWQRQHIELIDEIVDMDPTLAFRMHNVFCNVCGTVMYDMTHKRTQQIPSKLEQVIRDITSVRDKVKVSTE